MLVELIYDNDCPNVSEARELLLRAFSEIRLPPSWKEIDRQNTDSAPYAKHYGSPTILVNGADVADLDIGGRNDCCRLYLHGETYRGVPQLKQVVDALSRTSSLRRIVSIEEQNFLRCDYRSLLNAGSGGPSDGCVEQCDGQ
jgi:mercuric ion transport protein